MLKKILLYSLILLLKFDAILFAKTLDTVYGQVEVNEPVLIELLESEPVERLKKIHQYGIVYYISNCEAYSRYEHSIGVFAILRLKGASLEEQIAGLLHDISHTAFSHAGDYFFKEGNVKDAYQDDIHGWYLEKTKLSDILQKYGFSADSVYPKLEHFAALEQPLPNMSADRIDYNLQGAYLKGMITLDELSQIFKELEFDGKRWSMESIPLAKKLSRFSLHMTLNCWSSSDNLLWNIWLCDCLKQLLRHNAISYDDIHFGKDEELWNLIQSSSDAFIADRLKRMQNIPNYYRVVEESEANFHYKIKFRGIDPWIRTQDGVFRLTELDGEFAEEFGKVKALSKKGWFLKIMP